MVKGKKLSETEKAARKKKRNDREQKEFSEKVVKVKKEHSKEELLEIVQIQPFNHELGEFMAARKVLDELKVEYPLTFKVQSEERDIGAGFGKVKVEKPEEETPEDPNKKEEAPESEPEEKEESESDGTKISEEAALDLTKDEQTTLLEKLGAEDIPRYEKDRVALILKLQ